MEKFPQTAKLSCDGPLVDSDPAVEDEEGLAALADAKYFLFNISKASV